MEIGAFFEPSGRSSKDESGRGAPYKGWRGEKIGALFEPSGRSS